MFILLTVKEIHENQMNATIIFENMQQGQLNREHNDYDYYISLANESMIQQHPIGVILTDKNTITEIEAADNDIVAFVGEQDNDMLKVIFQGHDGFYYIKRNHANFTKLNSVINQSIHAKKSIWFIARNPQMTIEDAMLAKEK
jgi:hypothetical protein